MASEKTHTEEAQRRPGFTRVSRRKTPPPWLPSTRRPRTPRPLFGSVRVNIPQQPECCCAGGRLRPRRGGRSPGSAGSVRGAVMWSPCPSAGRARADVFITFPNPKTAPRGGVAARSQHKTQSPAAVALFVANLSSGIQSPRRSGARGWRLGAPWLLVLRCSFRAWEPRPGTLGRGAALSRSCRALPTCRAPPGPARLPVVCF